MRNGTSSSRGPLQRGRAAGAAARPDAAAAITWTRSAPWSRKTSRRAMPAHLPHWCTVYDVADGWHKSGATGKMHDELRRQCRIAAGREPESTAAVIDSQSVRAAEEVTRASRGYDAGKKVNGRKRHIAGKLVTWAKAKLKPRLALQIIKRPGDLHTFQVLPRRWVVERTLAWITRCRRSVRDYERLPAHHETIVYWAMTITLTRRLARGSASGEL